MPSPFFVSQIPTFVTMSSRSKFYTVWEGRRPGVYSNWEECKRQIEGYPNAKYKSFPSKSDAEKAWSEPHSRHLSYTRTASVAKSVSPSFKVGKPLAGSLCVDAACSGNPGDLEYRGVEFDSGREIFRMGPYKQGTNNVGEFLAIVHALALLQQQQMSERIIYSDSAVAIGWVKKKKCCTKLEHTRTNSVLFDLIHRAERWLENAVYRNPILKWETEDWGEIPADFGRK
jgi:ribonuclease HI